MDDWLFQDQPFPSTPSQIAPVKPTPRMRGPSLNSYETNQILYEPSQTNLYEPSQINLYGPSQIHYYEPVKDSPASVSPPSDNDEEENALTSFLGDPPVVVADIYPLTHHQLTVSLHPYPITSPYATNSPFTSFYCTTNPPYHYITNPTI